MVPGHCAAGTAGSRAWYRSPLGAKAPHPAVHAPPQGWGLQSRVWRRGPSHSAPPKAGGVQARLRVCTPASQGAEHSDQEDQGIQTPATAGRRARDPPSPNIPGPPPAAGAPRWVQPPPDPWPWCHQQPPARSACPKLSRALTRAGGRVAGLLLRPQPRAGAPWPLAVPESPPPPVVVHVVEAAPGAGGPRGPGAPAAAGLCGDRRTRGTGAPPAGTPTGGGVSRGDGCPPVPGVLGVPAAAPTSLGLGGARTGGAGRVALAHLPGVPVAGGSAVG